MTCIKGRPPLPLAPLPPLALAPLPLPTTKREEATDAAPTPAVSQEPEPDSPPPLAAAAALESGCMSLQWQFRFSVPYFVHDYDYNCPKSAKNVSSDQLQAALRNKPPPFRSLGNPNCNVTFPNYLADLSDVVATLTLLPKTSSSSMTRKNKSVRSFLYERVKLSRWTMRGTRGAMH